MSWDPVYRLIKKIPRGRVTTYGELARAFLAALVLWATRWLRVPAGAAFRGIVSSVQAAICASRNLTAPSSDACFCQKASTSIPAASTCPASAGLPSAANRASDLPFEAGKGRSRPGAFPGLTAT